MILTIAVTAGAAGFEAKLATWLLDVEATPPAVLDELDGGLDSFEALLDATKRLLTEPTTWTSLLPVALKFAFGVVAFTALVTATAVAASLLAAQLFYDAAGVSYDFGPTSSTRWARRSHSRAPACSRCWSRSACSTVWRSSAASRRPPCSATIS